MYTCILEKHRPELIQPSVTHCWILQNDIKIPPGAILRFEAMLYGGKNVLIRVCHECWLIWVILARTSKDKKYQINVSYVKRTNGGEGNCSNKQLGYDVKEKQLNSR